jgi:hypothetical protein
MSTMTGTSARPERSVWGAAISTVLAALVLALPVAFMAFTAWVSWSGCFFKCTGDEEPDVVATVVAVVIAGVLLLDVALCGVAGYCRWQRPWAWVALAPPVALLLTWVGGVLVGAF